MLKEKNLPEAYQVGFDLAEVATQAFIESVRQKIFDAGFGPEAASDVKDPVSPFGLCPY